MRENRMRRQIRQGPAPYDREFIMEIGMGDIEDFTMVEARWASEQRKPCRKGEYIVIPITGGLTTLIVCNVVNADNALYWRIQHITDPKNRDGTWLVTNGRVTGLYEHKNGRIERVKATWLGDYEHE